MGKSSFLAKSDWEGAEKSDQKSDEKSEWY